MNRRDQDQIDAILREARKARPKPSRAMWIAALSVGTLGLVAFGVILFTDGSWRGGAAPARDSRLGFTAGILIGVVVGVAIGFAIARQRAKSESHSARSNP
jgi:hypothetical protein